VNLADVLPSCLAALGADLSLEARIAFRPARSAIVVLVDGLGANALQARAGHARFLTRDKRRMRSGFPTTTAAALSTLTTGRSPGSHGVVGYSGWVPDEHRVANLLSGWDHEVPAGWLLEPTLFEAAAGAGIDPVAIGPGRYHSSGFTASVLGSARYVDADTIPERVDAALAAVGAPGQQLVYLYVPELDSIAHKRGWQDDRWTAALELLDGELARLADRIPADVGVVVTADHGILDVPEESNIAIDEALLEGVVGIAGDPRCRQLTLAEGADASALRDAWRTRYGKRAWIATRDEAIAAGWFGSVRPAVIPRIGDLVVVARASWAFNDDRELAPGEQPKRMLGQHGAMSDDETYVPLRLAGAFAS
jgi:hypothetical protein